MSNDQGTKPKAESGKRKAVGLKAQARNGSRRGPSRCLLRFPLSAHPNSLCHQIFSMLSRSGAGRTVSTSSR